MGIIPMFIEYSSVIMEALYKMPVVFTVDDVLEVASKHVRKDDESDLIQGIEQQLEIMLTTGKLKLLENEYTKIEKFLSYE